MSGDGLAGLAILLCLTVVMQFNERATKTNEHEFILFPSESLDVI